MRASSDTQESQAAVPQKSSDHRNPPLRRYWRSRDDFVVGEFSGPCILDFDERALKERVIGGLHRRSGSAHRRSAG